MADITVECDFCGQPFKWSDDDQRLDLALRLRGSGLGKMCPPCGDREVIAMGGIPLDREKENG